MKRLQSAAECVSDWCAGLHCVVRGNARDTSDAHYSHGGRNYTAGRNSNRMMNDEAALLDQTSRRGPRFNSARTAQPAADCFRSTVPRASQPRGNPGSRFGSTPRYSYSSDAAYQSSAAANSAGESQSKRGTEHVGTSQSASTAREHGLSSRLPVYFYTIFRPKPSRPVSMLSK